jgi:hypothetical protein
MQDDKCAFVTVGLPLARDAAAAGGGMQYALDTEEWQANMHGSGAFRDCATFTYATPEQVPVVQKAWARGGICNPKP